MFFIANEYWKGESMLQRRFLYLILAILTMLVSGVMYTFTVFSGPISADFEVAEATVSLIFSGSQCCFFVGGLILGYIFRKLDYKMISVLASAGIGMGLFLASRTNGMLTLFLTYCVLANISAGVLYKASMAAVLPWFSDEPGLVGGITLMGAGLTAFIFNLPLTRVIEVTDWRLAMALFALIALMITMGAALSIKVKPRQEKAEEVSDEQSLGIRDTARDVTTGEMLKSGKFHLFFVWSVLMLAGSTSVAGNAVGIAGQIGLSAGAAAVMTMILSAFNAISRIFYGALYDHKGRKVTMGMAGIVFAMGAGGLLLALFMRSVVLLAISFAMIGMSMGGAASIASAYILNTFGQVNYAGNYGVQGSFSLFSSFLGTTVFSFLYRFTDNYIVSYLYEAIYAAIILALYLALNRLMNVETAERHRNNLNREGCMP